MNPIGSSDYSGTRYFSIWKFYIFSDIGLDVFCVEKKARKNRLEITRIIYTANIRSLQFDFYVVILFFLYFKIARLLRCSSNESTCFFRRKKYKSTWNLLQRIFRKYRYLYRNYYEENITKKKRQVHRRRRCRERKKKKKTSSKSSH